MFSPPSTHSPAPADLDLAAALSNPQTLAAVELELARRLCREGNPFPLVALQWPELLITDPAEAKFFQGEIDNPDDPCLRIDDWQREMLRRFFDDSVAEIACKGNTRAGKGMVVSIAINLWFDVYDPCKIILTSQRFEHAVDVIFGEVAKWRQRMKSPIAGKLQKTSINDHEQHYLTIANPQSGEGFSGQHGPATLFVFDEATSVPGSFYDDAQKQARKIVALANPRVTSGWFHSAYKPCRDMNVTQLVDAPMGKRLCVTVDGAKVCNVRNRRLEKPLGPPGGITINDRRFEHNERIPPEYFAHVRPLIPDQCDYGRFMGIKQHRDPRHVDVFAHGKFPTEDAQKQVILQSWMPFHEAAWQPDNLPPVQCFGLDVAASLDGDKTVLVAGGEKGVRGIHRFAEPDGMKTIAWLLLLVQEQYGIDLKRGAMPVTVDSDGLGKIVGDRLRELGVWVIVFHGNATSEVDPKIYGNLRAEAYGEFGVRLNPAGRWGHMPYAMPPDDFLVADLCAPEKLYQSDALRFKISPKRRKAGMDERVVTIYDKLGRSPDTGDGTVYMFHAVRVLGLWSSFIGGIERATAAYPATMAEFQQVKEQVLKDATNPASDMDPDVRELLAGLMGQAERRGEVDGLGGGVGHAGLSARDRLVRQMNRRLD